MELNVKWSGDAKTDKSETLKWEQHMWMLKSVWYAFKITHCILCADPPHPQHSCVICGVGRQEVINKITQALNYLCQVQQSPFFPSKHLETTHSNHTEFIPVVHSNFQCISAPIGSDIIIKQSWFNWTDARIGPRNTNQKKGEYSFPLCLISQEPAIAILGLISSLFLLPLFSLVSITLFYFNSLSQIQGNVHKNTLGC